MVGIVSPNKNPHGFRGSIWSKMSLAIAVIGIDINIPGIPHKEPNASTTMMEMSALIFTFDATINGTM